MGAGWNGRAVSWFVLYKHIIKIYHRACWLSAHAGLRSISLCALRSGESLGSGCVCRLCVLFRGMIKFVPRCTLHVTASWTLNANYESGLRWQSWLALFDWPVVGKTDPPGLTWVVLCKDLLAMTDSIQRCKNNKLEACQQNHLNFIIDVTTCNPCVCMGRGIVYNLISGSAATLNCIRGSQSSICWEKSYC